MHTQGPWTAFSSTSGVYYVGPKAESGENFVSPVVAITKINAAVTDAQHRGNADLIAAAPDMLFELKVILKRFEIELEESPKSFFPGRAHTNDIRRVIAKAEGFNG